MAAFARSSCGMATLGFCGSSTARRGWTDMGNSASFRCRSGPLRELNFSVKNGKGAASRNRKTGSDSRAVVMGYADPSMRSNSSGGVEPQFVPRICTLREFSEDDSVELSDCSSLVSGMVIDEDRSLIGLMAATVEATAQATDFETLSGRLAMLGFATAVSLELFTGHGVFTNIDVDGLLRILGLCFISTLAAGSFAVLFKSRATASDMISSGCKRLLDGAVDSVIDGLFFQEDEAVFTQKK